MTLSEDSSYISENDYKIVKTILKRRNMSERRNTSNTYKKGQSHQRHPQNYENKTSLTTTLSILDYYLQTSSSPPFGHVIMNSLMRKSSRENSITKKEEIRILDRAEYVSEKQQKAIFGEQAINASYFMKSESEKTPRHLMIQLPVMTPEMQPFVRLWRKRIQRAVTMFGMNTNFQILVSYLVPKELEPLLQGHTSLEALLDIICHHYEKEGQSPLGANLRQENFLFIRDFYEAVKQTAIHCQILPVPEEQLQGLIMQTIVNGLTAKTLLSFPVDPSTSVHDYIDRLERTEQQMVAKLQAEYEKH
ncbi:hypothetical protein NEAUS04_0090 [Nematocida ausubeli]|uniref:Uncharacterized protein n=1 Tax=Nematocida ausubeli (strain ATCC PRA-371 / ERTm2) TaxID=1913371 RepID=A0A086J071_NEMA1|nr:uncharacterized protein NESG_02318 [Nematocida ausubeli]KAI5136358.1 hypothetical protein NEAUS07_1602 [Nematocida ausubeli]KAI5149571.1 hypothetical protein NEAUS05_1817 [Nematocida ausubeli]KAI5160693.1 hypothetical protein NEAUS04_0090 [Nematocida ausubeli]KFG25539.1 hypothetical protein NESG_02318 [Nematocida ausubeli]